MCDAIVLAVRSVAGLAASIVCIIALVLNAIGNDHGALQALIWAFALLMLSIPPAQYSAHRSKGE